LNAIHIDESSWHAKSELDELRRLLIGMLAPEAAARQFPTPPSRQGATAGRRAYSASSVFAITSP